MKMKKLLFTCAAVAGVSLAVSASAFADVAIENVKTTTDTTTASVETLPVPTKTDSQMTVVVVKLTAPATDATSVATPTTIDETNIIYIDQDAYAADMFQDMGLKDTLAVNDYYMVRVGGENLSDGITEEVYKVVSATTEPTYTLGDVTEDGGIDMGDAAAILNHFMGYTLITDTAPALAADVTKDGGIDMGDAAAVLNHFMGYTPIE